MSECSRSGTTSSSGAATPQAFSDYECHVITSSDESVIIYTERTIEDEINYRHKLSEQTYEYDGKMLEFTKFYMLSTLQNIYIRTDFNFLIMRNLQILILCLNSIKVLINQQYIFSMYMNIGR